MIFAASAVAGDGEGFIREFIDNYNRQDFKNQTILVKDNKAIINGAIDKLIQQALTGKISVDEKMYLLNIASSLAYMHFYWNGVAEPLDTVDAIVAKELKKEKARLDMLLKGREDERMLGNFVMSRHEEQMKKQGLPMVLFPHWLHRIMFECKLCHNSVFKMKRWSNNLSQAEIAGGKQCGTCHDGGKAFSATAPEQCQRCHMVGTPEAEQWSKPANVSLKRIKKATERVGSIWRQENLPGGKLPLDNFQFIDWLELKRNDVFMPLTSLNKDYKEETRDNKILFKAKSTFVYDVLFDHKIHSDWIKCSSCHPANFKDTLGGNNIKMMDMHKGRYCGYCHGKVSFTFADCKRCHKESNGHLPDSVLIR